MRNKPSHFVKVSCFIVFLINLSTAALAAETRFEKKLPGGGQAILTFAANPLVTMTETPFTVELIGGTGKVLSDAAVSLRLIMPAMSMPPNNPKAPWLEKSYHGTAVFTMAGEWTAIMIIQRPGHDVIDLDFDLGTVKMK